MYGNNDWRDYYEPQELTDELAHGWGWSPKMKAAEKKYNAWYWDNNKERIMRQRRRRAGLIGLLGRKIDKKKKSVGLDAVEEARDRTRNKKGNADETQSGANMKGWREKMAEYKAKKAEQQNNKGTFVLQKEEKKGKGGGSKSSKSPEEIAAAAAEKERKKQEKEAARIEREAERERKKKQREEDRAERDADREKRKQQREEDRQYREEERERKKKEREEDRKYKEEERERKKQEREAAAAEKEAAKAAKDEEKRAKENDNDRYNELVESYRRKNIDDDNHRSALNNYHDFRRELESSGHSIVDDDTGKKLWNKFKREVSRPKDSEVNEKGFVDKDVRKALLKKAQNDEKTRASITNYSSFIKALQDAGHSEVSKEEGAAMWKEYKKKIKSSNKKAKE